MEAAALDKFREAARFLEDFYRAQGDKELADRELSIIGLCNTVEQQRATIAVRDAKIDELSAHIREAASLDIAKRVDKNHRGCRISVAEWHLAALNHTEGKKKIDDAVDKAWGRFCAAMPDDQSPYPGMAKAFEVHYGVSWTDRDWRNEQSTWAAAWRMAWDRRATVLDAEQDAARLDFLDSIGAAYGFEDREVHLIISIECVSGMDDVVEQ